MFEMVSMRTFSRLVGQVGTEVVRYGKRGTSFLLPDGRSAHELRAGERWNWFLSRGA